ncbi:MAG: 4Fe-4S binding protein [Oscillospiraceae bacterium]|jgi:NAD-dependent dihydropyrimidine dehydrogenase PreA subunit|nr:4Fe-4S binding protein [Oscillospiraceae bacterium]
MLRKIIQINEQKCDGCGLCVRACHEGALSVAGGKARLVRDNFCDGMGDCLPECPRGAISFAEREAAEYDAQAVSAAKHAFPIQIKLVSPAAPQLRRCDLLVAADCTAFVRADFKRELCGGKAVVIGCPKLDGADYSEKLAQIISENEVQSVTVVKMEVPCCYGIELAARTAVQKAERDIPVSVITVGTDGGLK